MIKKLLPILALALVFTTLSAAPADAATQAGKVEVSGVPSGQSLTLYVYDLGLYKAGSNIQATGVFNPFDAIADCTSLPSVSSKITVANGSYTLKTTKGRCYGLRLVDSSLKTVEASYSAVMWDVDGTVAGGGGPFYGSGFFMTGSPNTGVSIQVPNNNTSTISYTPATTKPTCAKVTSHPAVTVKSPMKEIVTIPDVTCDGYGEVLAIDSAGKLLLYPGGASGSLGIPWQVGHSFTGYTLYPTEDMNSDGIPDLVGRSAGGYLTVYHFGLSGTIESQITWGGGWNNYTVVAPGKVAGKSGGTQDAYPDLIALRNSDGNLFLYPGDGKSGFGTPYQIGHGWGAYKNGNLFAVGDKSKDGYPDLAIRTSTGILYRYPITKGPTFGTLVQVGQKWTPYEEISMNADIDGNGTTDIVARKDGKLYYWPGNANGTYAAAKQIGSAGW
jgi:hypothetical protein